MNDQQESHWLRNHVAIAPVGSLIATLVLSAIAHGSLSVSTTADYAELGILVYGSIAGIVDRGAHMIFWALEQRKKREAKRQADFEASLQEAIEERLEAMLEQAVSDGMPVENLLRQVKEGTGK